MKARYQDPNLGRFISQDPVFWDLSVNLADPQGWNSYAYARNNPVTMVDRNGKWYETAIDLGFVGYDQARMGQASFGMSVNATKYLASAFKGDKAGMSAAGQAFAGKAGDLASASKDFMVDAAMVAVPLASAAHYHGAKALADSSALSEKNKNVWSSKPGVTSEKNALNHWSEHGKQFPEYKNINEYVEGAQKFMSSVSGDVVSKVRSTGDLLKYNQSTNVFGAQNNKGAIKTMFKPDTGPKYWSTQ